MKPLSPHWADQTAVRIIGVKGDKPEYTVASGITPSGRVHFGNFREVITVDLVARALKSLGKNVRFIYSWDNFDTFRKVPKNVPEPEAFEKHLRQPIARIPDPWGETDSYAAGRIALFEKELEAVGIKPNYLYQEAMYSQGKYAELIREALENKDKIASILNQYRKSPLPESWLPTSIYCSNCHRDETSDESYLGEWKYSYTCAHCGHSEEFDIRESKNIKLAWRTDWPMRWKYEGVDFEPGGKDHSSEGGSYDTAKEISEAVWGFKPPVYLQYDFVAIKGGAGKMSSSSGELVSLADVLEVYTPQMVRWIFAGQKPNRDFSVAFDEDVIKMYEEFDKAEAIALGPCPEKPGKWPVIRRGYELSSVDGTIPEEPPFRPAFRELCNRLQICSGNIERVLERYYFKDVQTEEDRVHFYSRAQCALNWLNKHAPENFRYSIRESRTDQQFSDDQLKGISALRELLNEVNLDEIQTNDLNQLIYDKIIRGVGVEAKAFFASVYQSLISRDQGPRLPSFLKELGKEKVMELL